MIKLRLKELREHHQFSQKEVAEKIGISRVRYNQYETGKRNPDYEILIKLAQLYACSVDYLLSIQEHQTYHLPSESISPDLKNAGIEAIHVDLQLIIAEAKKEYAITDEDIKEMIELAKKLKGSKKDFK